MQKVPVHSVLTLPDGVGNDPLLNPRRAATSHTGASGSSNSDLKPCLHP